MVLKLALKSLEFLEMVVELNESVDLQALFSGYVRKLHFQSYQKRFYVQRILDWGSFWKDLFVMNACYSGNTAIENEFEWVPEMTDLEAGSTS